MVAGTNSRVFFNEFHYDNDGSDTGEFIEIANTEGVDLTGWTVVLYNGGNGEPYNTITLTGSDPFITLAFPSNGIQNGSPDGFALVDPLGNVVQFLSYEGVMTAISGPAAGLTSTDIGVQEISTTPAGFSLQLTGSGQAYGDFTWGAAPVAATQGSANTGQSITDPFTPTTIFSQNFDDFRGLGFAPDPAAGQLDSDTFRVIGMSDGDGTFGGTHTSGDFARGTDSDGAVSTGGIYAFVLTAAPDDYNFGFQPGGSDVTPGSLDILITNSGSDTNSFDIAYSIEFNNNEGRSNSLNLQYSTDGGVTFVAVPAFDFTTPEIADGNGFTSAARSGTVTLDSTIANGASFILRFATDDVGGAGSRDEIAIDDITVTTAEPVTAANPGALSIDDVSLAEGDSGTTDFTFTVTRANGSDGEVSVDYSVSGSGSDPADAADFGGAFPGGTVTFADGESSRTITIPVSGDADCESDETFEVTLSNATGGATIAVSTGLGTITNDDRADPMSPGTFSIDDVTAAEGDTGTTDFTFTITRTDGAAGAVDVDYTVVGQTADAADFGGTLSSGTVSFADGETSRTVVIAVSGDSDIETDETFEVQISSETPGVQIADGIGVGTIQNDDFPPVGPAQIFINEIHYDNFSGDVGEAVEIAGPAGTDLSGWSLVLYNGNGGASYGTISLSGIIADQDDGFGTLSFAAPASGLQNGSPDGLALVDPAGRVIQFLSYEGTMIATNGPANGLTSTDIGVEEDGGTPAGFSVQLVGSGNVANDFTWQSPTSDSFGAVNTGQDFTPANPNGALYIGDASFIEGNSGTGSITFNVFRVGGASGAISANYAASFNAAFGNADAADFAGATSGTVNFADGQSVATITLEVAGDVAPEPNEFFDVVLSGATGGADIGNDTGRGTLLNDDPLDLLIGEIQGAGHASAFVDNEVTTRGIVTAVTDRGFYLQDAGDGNAATSDAILVFTDVAPTVAIGDAVTVTGTVVEFLGGGDPSNLTITELVNPTVTVTSSDNALPDAVLIGPDGVTPPTEIIDDDGFAVFDPENDGIDFWESLEGMRVTVQNPVAVDATNGFGELWAVASDGAGNLSATNVSESGLVVLEGGEGGLGVFNQGSGSDFNPERIQIDVAGALNGLTLTVPDVTPGVMLNDVTGIVEYSFGNYEVRPSEEITVAQASTNEAEVTALSGAQNQLTVASYNVLNLDRNDADGDEDVASGRFDAVAFDIAVNLALPDIVVLQEVQDDSGSANDGTVSAQLTLQALADAIFAESGVRYSVFDNPFVMDGANGGQPGGNIRVAFLYRDDRVDFDESSAFTITDPDDGALADAFQGSRAPLGGTFSFNGEEVTVIGNHFTSKIGSDTTFSANQPPANAGALARAAQAAALNAYIDGLLGIDPDANIVVAGDFNEFQFEEPMRVLTGELDFTGGTVSEGSGAVLTNLTDFLAPEERYSVLFQGNAQQLDHILATGALADGAAIDVVHVNIPTDGFASDHDPVLVRLNVGFQQLTGDGVDNTIDGNDGKDLLRGGSGNDTLNGFGAADFLRGGAGDDTLSGSSGNDDLRGGIGIDLLNGGAGDDLLIGGSDSDTLNGDAGNDTLIGGKGADQLYGGEGIDMLFGGNQEDVLRGGMGDDTLFGQNQPDLLFGDDGNDTLNGGNASDWLDGGLGMDILTGGSGNDTFVLHAGGDAGDADVITDFSVEGSGRDSIVIDGAEGRTISFVQAGKDVQILADGVLIGTVRASNSEIVEAATSFDSGASSIFAPDLATYNEPLSWQYDLMLTTEHLV